ncbi:MAG: c-type cytochrome [Chitinophagaceae bacterium]|nr:c-type cytochrome [Chitinophagaceae bacterium]
MIPCKPIGQRLTLLFLSFFVFSIVNVSAQDGKALFMGKCASCHAMGKDMTGPNLEGLEERWQNTDQIKVWIKNWAKAVSAGYPQAVKVQNYAPSAMTAFEGSITDAEIDAILKYIREWKPVVVDPQGGGTVAPEKGNSNAVIFGVISLILGIIALILMQVNSNLKKMSDDAEGISRPDPVPFYKNKAYIAMAAIVFFVIGGYLVAKGAIGLGRQKDYQPVQPIYYSHKVHAGINQINCQYCHSSVTESKHATIPSVNVCMNCHKAINTYEKGPKLYDENGDEINGTAEIEKLYKYAGFDPKNAAAWDPSKAKPIEWVKIHNLPDHVYFNHSQHVKTGKVQCQSCHGEITQMDEVKQASELSMGWCVNCHRETKVDFNYDSTGNKFYSIYEKFHNDLKTSELAAIKGNTTLNAKEKKFKIDSLMKLVRMDSVRVQDIGGLECQKCHY